MAPGHGPYVSFGMRCCERWTANPGREVLPGPGERLPEPPVASRSSIPPPITHQFIRGAMPSGDDSEAHERRQHAKAEAWVSHAWQDRVR
jgi:hypothetical protein